ncbi:MAG: universal stress protein [Tindallia sp. MSAO_Bac2]|nr:MAG: universal stress protein [Tindallia sp. MSAO_Bac2]
MKKILVALDGSETSQKVIEEAVKVAEKNESDIAIITVVKSIRPTLYHPGSNLHITIDNEFEKRAKEITEKAREAFENVSGKVETHIEYGDPAEEILKMADKMKADLIVMGSRGLSDFKRVMLGSVSTKVLNHADCDMLIVRGKHHINIEAG